MKWQRRPLEEVADFCLGKMLDQKKNRGELRPYLANVNVRWGNFELNHLREMRFEASEEERYGLKCGDIVMCEGGEPGRCAIWQDERPGMMLQKALHRIRPRNGLDHRFLYYAFLSQGRTGELSGLFTGSTIKHLPREKLAKAEVPMPPVGTQERIAELLCAYDDLIENNRKRIALLEEAARLLYREWFVHLRFPGHEHVKVVDGVPEGWGRGAVGAVLELRYGKALKESDRVAGLFHVYGSSGVVGTHKTALVEGPAIVVGRKGNVGSVYWSPCDFWPIDTVYYVPRDQSDFWLYLTLPSAGFQNTDAGVPGLNRGFAYSRKVLLPSQRLRRFFDEAVEPMFAQITTLENLSRRLAQARNLLLPRLMNGEIAT